MTSYPRCAVFALSSLILAMTSCATPRVARTSKFELQTLDEARRVRVKPTGLSMRVLGECVETVTEYFCTNPKEYAQTAVCRGAKEQSKKRPARCSSEQASIRALTLETPWGTRIPATFEQAGTAQFAIDWSAANIDPLSSDAEAQLSVGWRIRGPGGNGFVWQPDRARVGEMIERIGVATSTEVTVGEAEGVPKLVVVAFEVVGGAMRVGAANKIRMTLANHGSGPAYRLVGQVHSGLPSLRGRQFSFGSLQPGENKTRTVRVTLPVDVSVSSALLVVELHLAGTDPKPVRKRFEIDGSIESSHGFARHERRCPDGAVSQSAYDVKRERLERLLRRGDVGQEEFDQLDAELILCIDL